MTMLSRQELVLRTNCHNATRDLLHVRCVSNTPPPSNTEVVGGVLLRAPHDEFVISALFDQAVQTWTYAELLSSVTMQTPH